MQKTHVWSLSREGRSLEKEIATHSSILAWRIPRTEKPGGLQSLGSQRVRYDWATNTTQKLGRQGWDLGPALSDAVGRDWAGQTTRTLSGRDNKPSDSLQLLGHLSCSGLTWALSWVFRQASEVRWAALKIIISLGCLEVGWLHAGIGWPQLGHLDGPSLGLLLQDVAQTCFPAEAGWLE